MDTPVIIKNIGSASSPAGQAAATVPPERPINGAGAEEALTPACRAAQQYNEITNEGRFSDVGALFADEVDYIGPDAIARSTREEVDDLYRRIGMAVKSRPPHSRIVRLVPVNLNECFYEFDQFEHETGSYRLAGIAHFIVDDEGKIVWFRPFFQQMLERFKPRADTEHGF